ncbi:MAG: hypothetical protein HYR66_03565 [Sphingobacteriales bacterium]|nr:hypothetical protein [Sphingobacteriales bacterium]MBI3718557.1 hypothetical protein [Sphingobacteriales bacterium]
MTEQNFKNHGRYVPMYHFVAFALWLAILIGSIVNLVNSAHENLYSASLLVAISVLLLIILWYARAFALKAQDRAIRAEENLRHFILTGKPLDSRLRMSQIIALRFAPDNEFMELAKKSAAEKISAKEIKAAIKNWKADHHRA